ncbi:hypothetical protein [Rhodococcus tukisamuensis]|uniref:RiboL-PSP-HEPN domain-containing protein n=1 Tax=Rhodococcus tukisamuensis TaxID=168276 RepID=A0A1G6TBX8_9NOCA|nr:hypothetical protein [Rhodococcus tukisamuensis]SDD26364.1 hypothetical protein SAMN05444580_103462 [Rhodococcus tukisamuensis]
MSAPLLSLDAENSQRLINQTLAAHREMIDALSLSDSRARRLAAVNVADREQLQRQATLVRFLSITESFCTERLLIEMEKAMAATSHPGAQVMWEDSHDRAIGTWDSLKQTYKSWLGVDPKLWETLLILAKARNAVAHGYGQLTWKQQRDPNKRRTMEGNFRKFGITMDGTRVVLAEKSIDDSADVCHTFIRSLDEALRIRS